MATIGTFTSNGNGFTGTVRTLDNNRALMDFDAPVMAITPGQAVVFYDGDVVVGGGWIDG